MNQSGGTKFEMVRVLIVSFDSLARNSLQAALSGFEDLGIVGLANLDQELPETVDAFRPDVILAHIDDDVDVSDWLELLLEMDLPLLVLSDQQQPMDPLANGWLSHSSSPGQIRTALLAVVHGLIVHDKEQHLANISPQNGADETLIEPMTPRELEVLQLVAEGLTNRAIAFQLGISEFTVKFHINAILTKLDAQSRTEASIKAARLGLILL